MYTQGNNLGTFSLLSPLDFQFMNANFDTVLQTGSVAEQENSLEYTSIWRCHGNQKIQFLPHRKHNMSLLKESIC
jgi:hypothetical protein